MVARSCMGEISNSRSGGYKRHTIRLQECRSPLNTFPFPSPDSATVHFNQSELTGSLSGRDKAEEGIKPPWLTLTEVLLGCWAVMWRQSGKPRLFTCFFL